MARVTYDKQLSALLVIDPYNDSFLRERNYGTASRAVADANSCVPHMVQDLNAARQAKIRVFYALHHRYRPGEYETWNTLRRSRRQLGRIRPSQTARGVARWPSSIGSSGHTDLDLQLEKNGVDKVIVMGLIAHTCVEATVRYAAELGDEITMVKDATADYSDEEMHAALDINIPNYSSAIVTNEVADSISPV